MSVLSSATSTRPCAATGSRTASAGRSGPAGSHRSASVTKGSATAARSAGSPPSASAGPIRSGGRCSWPRGSVTVNVVPRSGVLSTAIAPPCRPTSSRTTASPMPLPSPDRARARSTRWNRSNRRGSSSAGMPVPVSVTVSSAERPWGRSPIPMRPSKVNFTALDSRLRTICSHMSRST